MGERLTVAIIGSGAVGTYYGARLLEAGHDVRFLLRRDYQAVREKGLKITSPEGDFTIEHPAIALKSEEIGQVDWVICALKATSIQDARDLVRPCVKENTRILVLMNGLGLEERFAEWFNPERIFGGLAFTCINRGEPGYVHHLAYGPVTLGHFRNNTLELEIALALWKGSKVKVIASPSLRRSRWEKLGWNIPFSGLSVAAGGVTTDRIVGDPALRQAALELMQEVVRAGNADLAASGEDSRIEGDVFIRNMFRLTDAMGPYRPSLMIDFIEGRPMEVEAIFSEPLRRIRSLGVEAPYLTLLTALLRALDSTGRSRAEP